jgi:predicted nucleotidyltransferase component of viral defense system
MPKGARNMGASVRTRLLNLSKQRNESFQLLSTRYVLERLLYRLSTTKYRERFVLKGAMLLATWINTPFRPTRDLDFLAFGDANPDAMLAVFREICAVSLDDGVAFDAGSLTFDRNRDDLEYGGLRIKANATIAGARVRVIVDIGFGDAVEPEISELDFLVLLDQPSPRLRTYPREAVIAEKFQAMAALGRANSRMKDFYDIWELSRAYQFDEERLAKAIRATFQRRKTEIPAEPPDALTTAFAQDDAKRQQWNSFVQGIEAEAPDLATIIADLSSFLMPCARAARKL